MRAVNLASNRKKKCLKMERNMMRTRKTTWTMMLLKITGLKMLQMMNLPKMILKTKSHKPPQVHVIKSLVYTLHSFIMPYSFIQCKIWIL